MFSSSKIDPTVNTALNVLNILRSKTSAEEDAITTSATAIVALLDKLENTEAVFHFLIEKVLILEEILPQEDELSAFNSFFKLLHILSASGDVKLLKSFLSCIPKDRLPQIINENHPPFGSPLFFSLYSSNPDIAKTLIEFGADKTKKYYNQFYLNSHRLTPFETAAFSGRSEFLNVFLIDPKDCTVESSDFFARLDHSVRVLTDLPDFSLKTLLITPDNQLPLSLFKIKHVADFFIEKNWPGSENYKRIMINILLPTEMGAPINNVIYPLLRPVLIECFPDDVDQFFLAPFLQLNQALPVVPQQNLIPLSCFYQQNANPMLFRSYQTTSTQKNEEQAKIQETFAKKYP